MKVFVIGLLFVSSGVVYGSHTSDWPVPAGWAGSRPQTQMQTVQ
jgi:hypothetical protein